MRIRKGLRIVVAHNRYQIAGGEDKVVNCEMALLRKNGVEVIPFEVDNSYISDFSSKIRAAASVTYSAKSHQLFKLFVSRTKPDLVHVHNWFPLLTPSVYDACNELRVPIAQTLHNFRITCASGLLMRQKKICELCINGSPYNGVRYGCYRGSRIASVPVSRMISVHRNRDTWNKKPSRLIVPSEFAKTRFIKAGINETKLVVKPHFASEPIAVSKTQSERSGALFVGRLSQEKGLDTLLAAFKKIDLPLRIAGEGPMLSIVKRAENGKIKYLGPLSTEGVSEEMSRARMLVVPSECYETFGMVVVEAFAHATPVVASKIGSLEELVAHEKSGLHFTVGDEASLIRNVERLDADAQLAAKIGQNGRAEFEAKYSENSNYNALIRIYEDILATKSNV